MSRKYYQESAEINYPNLGFGMAILFVLTLVLGYCYGMLMYFIPIIYANVFMSVGLGIALLLCFNLVVTWMKIRGQKSKIILGVGAIIFVSCFQWFAFLGSVLLESFPTPIQYLNSILEIFQSGGLFAIIGEIYTYGTWSLGSSGIPVSGLLLLLVWIIEVVIVSLPIAKRIWYNPVIPFSKKYNKWYSKYTLENDYQSIISLGALEDRFKDGVSLGVQSLGQGRANSHTKVHLYFLEGENDHYVSVDKVYIEDQGKGKMKVTPIMQNYRIDTTTAREMQRTFEMRNSGNLQLAEFKSFSNL